MAYKVFQNGFPLPASDLNNYLMNQSVIVFADSAARSAAITTPVEGMLTYLESTNAYEGWNGSAWTDINDNTSAIPKSTVTTAGDLIVATGSAAVTRLGIGGGGALLKSNGTTASWLALGTTGKVLTSNGTDATWESNPSGGMTEIATTTLSGASVNFTSIPGTYQELKLVIQNANMNVDSNYRIRFNGNTGSIYGSISQQTATQTLAITDAGVLVPLAEVHDVSDGALLNSITHIMNYSTGASVKMGVITNCYSDAASANFRVDTRKVYFRSTSAISEILVTADGNTWTAGTATLYGVK